MNRILASILAAALTLSTGCRKAPVTSSEIISTAEQIISTDGRGTHETDKIPDEQTQQTVSDNPSGGRNGYPFGGRR